MKQILLLFALCLVQFSVAQDVEKAYEHYLAGQLDQAQSIIDEAVKDDKLRSKHKTWRYRAKIYLAIAQSKDENYQQLSSNPLLEMFSSYVYSQDYGLPDSEYPAVAKDMEAADKLARAWAKKALTDGDCKEASKHLDVAIKTSNYLVQSDPMLLEQAGQASEECKDYRSAARYYQRCISSKHKTEEMYVNRARVLELRKKDNLAEMCLKEGYGKFPENVEIKNALKALYEKLGKTAEAAALEK